MKSCGTLFRVAAWAAGLGCVAPASAQSVEPRASYVCIVDAAAGLEWSTGRWAATAQKSPGKFILTLAREGGRTALTLKGDGVRESCHPDGAAARMSGELLENDRPPTQCLSGNGVTIYFAEKEERGVIARLAGAARLTMREPLLLLPFTCQRF